MTGPSALIYRKAQSWRAQRRVLEGGYPVRLDHYFIRSDGTGRRTQGRRRTAQMASGSACVWWMRHAAQFAPESSECRSPRGGGEFRKPPRLPCCCGKPQCGDFLREDSKNWLARILAVESISRPRCAILRDLGVAVGAQDGNIRRFRLQRTPAPPLRNPATRRIPSGNPIAVRSHRSRPRHLAAKVAFTGRP